MSTLLWQFAVLLVATLALFAALSAAMSMLTRRVGEARLRRWVGGGTVLAPVKGLVFGIITPFCSWSTIPVLMSLLRSRVRTSAVAAFFLASPVLDPVLLVVVAWLFGLWVALWFTAFLTVAILLAAHVAERLQLERLVLAPTGSFVTAGEGAASCERTEPAWQGWRAELAGAGQDAWTQTRQLFAPLLVTCVVGVAIAGAAPSDLLTGLDGASQPYAIAAAAVVGVPLYLPTEALAPLAWAMRDAGVGIGPIFAFLVTAASLSLPEFFLLARVVRFRLVLGLVVTITAIAVSGALLVPLLADP